MNALRGATHVHLACHGSSIADRPLRSHVVLACGEKLTLLDLLADDDPASISSELLGDAALVVASACETAVVDTVRIPDEFVGLPAGFLAAGVAGFVGTLWLADDTPSALIMSRFYDLLFSPADADPPLRADAALRAAQRWLRDAAGPELADYLDARPALRAAAGNRSAFLRLEPRPFASPSAWAAHVFVGAAQPLAKRPAQ